MSIEPVETVALDNGISSAATILHLSSSLHSSWDSKDILCSYVSYRTNSSHSTSPNDHSIWSRVTTFHKF